MGDTTFAATDTAGRGASARPDCEGQANDLREHVGSAVGKARGFASAQKSDCSGFVGWCFGLPRKPRQIGEDTKLGTDQIYDDAVRDAGNRLFASTDNIIVYPNYWSAPGRGDSGHVASLTGKEARGRFHDRVRINPVSRFQQRRRHYVQSGGGDLHRACQADA